MGTVGKESRDYSNRSVRRTHSDVGGGFLIGGKVHHVQDPCPHRHSYTRQYSSPQPLKLRPLHRLPNTNSGSLHRNKR